MIHMGPYGYYMKYNNKNIRIDQNSSKWTKDYIISKLKTSKQNNNINYNDDFC